MTNTPITGYREAYLQLGASAHHHQLGDQGLDLQTPADFVAGKVPTQQQMQAVYTALQGHTGSEGTSGRLDWAAVLDGKQDEPVQLTEYPAYAVADNQQSASWQVRLQARLDYQRRQSAPAHVVSDTEVVQALVHHCAGTAGAIEQILAKLTIEGLVSGKLQISDTSARVIAVSLVAAQLVERLDDLIELEPIDARSAIAKILHAL